MRITHGMIDHVADLETLMAAAVLGYRGVDLPEAVVIPYGVPERLRGCWRDAFETGFVDKILASVPPEFISSDDD
ncbi:hypothetical protein [Roseomonas genomospecies 6]|uniref:Uncharacterized protein n=1 Tax=Roseomonas genomospecies 6 TaxID=214106 RepID=A0A9W7KQM9_9PROT|nr:hypothetical protein [Roseomonas genomospecies 6]KAA0677623.1 hypothetical protein DS843_22550 [Roseomonas genomospecies 6]